MITISLTDALIGLAAVGFAVYSFRMLRLGEQCLAELKAINKLMAQPIQLPPMQDFKPAGTYSIDDTGQMEAVTQRTTKGF